jgi:predicted transglutaminase-like cysteine proteinase
MGVADFWANAGETLRRGTGDAEDIAIAKMQVLKAAGFDPKDLTSASAAIVARRAYPAACPHRQRLLRAR